MIHLIIREPIAYQRTLCRALDQHFDGEFIAWFASGGDSDFATRDNFQRRFLGEVGFQRLFSVLRTDRDPVIILGGWSSALAYRTLLIAAVLRVPTLIWADHPFPRNRRWLFDALRKVYLRMLGRFVVAFLGCGTPTVEHLVSLGIPQPKVFNFPYWVEVPADWSPPPPLSDAGSSTKPLRLLAIGRLVPIKSFDVAIRAVARANQNAGARIAELIIIGDGPERHALESLVGSLGPQSMITFTGTLENAKVFAHVSEADAVIVPSKFEPYGVVVLEALAHGRPVFASDKVIAALDRNEGSGAIQLHSAGDAEGLARQITRLAGDREVLRKSSQAARVIAEAWRPERSGSILDEVFGRQEIAIDAALSAKPEARAVAAARH